MKAWTLEQGDLVLSQGQIAWIEGRQELAQSVQIRLGTRLGEYFFDPNMGLDSEGLLGKQVTEDTIREAILRCLAEEERIRSIDELEVVWDKTSRSATIQMVCTGLDGEEVRLEDVNISGLEA